MTAAYNYNLASLLGAQGDLAGARPLYERALAISEKALGAEHPSTAASLNNLATLLQDQGDIAGARPLYERALAIYKKALGPPPETRSAASGRSFSVARRGPDRSRGLPLATPELETARRLALYGAKNERIRGLPRHKASRAKLAFVQLRQRLLSSIAAFAKTLRVHKTGLERLIQKRATVELTAPEQIIEAETAEVVSDLGLEGEAAEEAIAADEAAAAEAAAIAGAAEAPADSLRVELAMVDGMLSLVSPSPRARTNGSNGLSAGLRACQPIGESGWGGKA